MIKYDWEGNVDLIIVRVGRLYNRVDIILSMSKIVKIARGISSLGKPLIKRLVFKPQFGLAQNIDK